MELLGDRFGRVVLKRRSTSGHSDCTAELGRGDQAVEVVLPFLGIAREHAHAIAAYDIDEIADRRGDSRHADNRSIEIPDRALAFVEAVIQEIVVPNKVKL